MGNIVHLFHRVCRINRFYFIPFFVTEIVSLGIKVIQILFPKRLFVGLNEGATHVLILNIVLYLGVLGILNCARIISEHYKEKNSLLVKTCLSADLYEANCVSKFADFEKYEARKKFELAKEGLQKGNIAMMIDNVVMCFSNIVFIISVSYVFHYLSWWISIVMLISVLINTACEYFRVKYDYDCYEKYKEVNMKMVYSRDKLTWKQFGKEIRLFGLYDYVSNIAEKYINELSAIQKNKSKRIFLVYFLLGLYDMLQRFLLIAYIVWLCSVGRVSIEDFTSLIVAVIACFSAVNDNAKLIVKLGESVKYVNCYFELMNASICNKFEMKEQITRFQKIKISNMKFTYPNSQSETLRGISVTFDAGKKYGIVGKNGSGKTTFIKLLLGLYEVPEGVITLDCRDKTEYHCDEWYSMFSAVLQDFNVYAYTLGDNISMLSEMNKDISFDGLEIDGVSLDDYLSAEYGEGHDVSGGEAQKIAIMRVLFHKAPVVILDEPTAALSPDGEIRFYEEVKTRFCDRTLFLVSHRLASCKLCDNILVFDKGQIVENGTHDDLMKKKGLYYEMYSSQKDLYACK